MNETRTTSLVENAASARNEVRFIAHLISTQPQEDWVVAELAERVHLSPSQLRRVFTRAYGMPPVVFIARARARRMALLLSEQPSCTIEEVAALAGWNSRTHATAAFTKHIGITPGAYRAQLRRAGWNGAQGLAGGSDW